MNIDDYRYVATVADLGSFTNAAKQLFIAQPSLSQRIKHIEEDYGIIIFIRDPKKGVQLTEEGKCFVKYAKRILRSEEDLRQEIEDLLGSKEKKLRIVTTQLVSSYIFDQIIKEYHRNDPSIRFEFIQVMTDDVNQILRNGEADIAICYTPRNALDISFRTIVKDQMVFVPAKGSDAASKIAEMELMEGDEIPLSLLDGEPMATNIVGTRIHDFVTGLEKEYGISPDIQHYSKNYSSLYSIARAGIASTVLMESFFSPLEDHEPYYAIEGAPDDLDIVVAWRKNTYLTNTMKDLIDIARKVDM